jgi:hypothetical protein
MCDTSVFVRGAPVPLLVLGRRHGMPSIILHYTYGSLAYEYSCILFTRLWIKEWIFDKGYILYFSLSLSLVFGDNGSCIELAVCYYMMQCNAHWLIIGRLTRTARSKPEDTGMDGRIIFKLILSYKILMPCSLYLLSPFVMWHYKVFYFSNTIISSVRR